MEYKSGCLVCGAELVYLHQNESRSCFYCGQVQETSAYCANGHYVCDRCHSLGANDLIEQFCTHTQQTDPLEMAVTLMKNPAVKMHGPEHHFLVPAVLLAAFYNQQGADEKAGKIKQARKRAEDVKGGFCGFCGDCGAAVGTGIFISLVTGATPLSRREWQLSNRMTAESLMSISDYGGPRCCKRDSYLAILSAGSFLKHNLNTILEMDESIQCEFSPLNKECLQGECPFYNNLYKKSGMMTS
jgi:Family of unknown function (DUF5714)